MASENMGTMDGAADAGPCRERNPLDPALVPLSETSVRDNPVYHVGINTAGLTRSFRPGW